MFKLILSFLIFFQTEDFNTYTIFPFMDKFYRINSKTISHLNKGGWINHLEHNLDLNDFNFNYVENGSEIYLISAGGGKVYMFKNDSLINLDNSHQWKSNFESDNFILNDTIFSFGGYGYFNFKNELLYFDKNTGGWNLYKELNQIQERSKHIGYFNTNLKKYFIGLGVNYHGNLRDLYSYNFEDGKIEEIGFINNDFDDFFIVKNFRTPLIITKNKIFQIHFIEGVLREYTSPNKIIESIRSITYNSNNNQFLILKNFGSNKPILLNESALLGPNYIETPFKKKHNYSNLIIISISLFGLLFIIWNIKTKKNKIDKNLLLKELNQLESKVFNYLFYSKNKIAKYSELYELIEMDLSYESKVKKINYVIINLNEKIKQFSNDKNKFLLIRKNAEDRRMKEVVLNEVILSKFFTRN